MTILDMLYYAAAAWYISYSLTQMHGPFGVFAQIRKWLPLGGLTACIICLMVWAALILSLIGRNVVTDALAIAGVALWLHGFTGWRLNL